MRKVLIVTYYWPPAGGAGVQRIAKFCKYLPEFGWEPVILTVKNGKYAITDESLLPDVARVKHVHRAFSLEPHGVYRAIGGLLRGHRAPRTPDKKGTHSAPRWLQRLADCIRLNVFIPDSRIGWLSNACRVGARIIERDRVDLLLSSVPPYTPHLIAGRLKARFSIPWIADFRDPWFESHTYNTAPRLPPVKWLTRRLEKKSLLAADHVICANWGIRDVLAAKLEPFQREKFHIITNGYDAGDASEVVTRTEHFVVSYFGTMYSLGFPRRVLDAIARLVDTDADFARDFSLRIVGDVGADVRTELTRAFRGAHVSIRPYVPHAEMLEMLYQEQVLTVLVNQVPLNTCIAPAKLYECLPTGNPILAIGPVDGDADRILRETGTGRTFGYGDGAGISTFLREQYRAWRAGRLNTGPRTFPEYERENLTARLAELFDQVLDSTNDPAHPPRPTVREGPQSAQA